MIKRGRFLRVIISAALAAAMIFSAVGCGQKDSVDVSEYGGEDVDISAVPEKDETNIAEDIEITSEADDSEDAKQSDTKSFTWNEALDAQGKVIDIDAYVEIPDLKSLNVYNASTNLDKTYDEKELVDKLFDSDVEELKEVKYTNADDYIIQLYKLDRLTAQFNREETMIDFVVIDSNYQKTFKWVDLNSYSIHMYKGKYMGMNYALILGYDHDIRETYIYFMPISIKELFPDRAFKTLVAKRSVDKYGNPNETDNKCNMAEDDVKTIAEDFLEGRIGMSDFDSKIGLDPYEYSSSVSDMNLGMYEESDDNKCMSTLVFSEGEYIATAKSIKDETYRHNILLAEQENRAQEYMDTSPNATDLTSATFNLQIQTEPLPEDQLFEDGYAVYLDDIYNVYAGQEIQTNTTNGIGWGFSSAIGNQGCIMVNEKGVIGVDLMLKYRTNDVVENVELLKFDKIQESIRSALENDVDIKSLGEGALTLPGISLCYTEVRDLSDENKVSLVPSWKFLVFSDNGASFVKINAIDGSLIMNEVINDM